MLDDLHDAHESKVSFVNISSVKAKIKIYENHFSSLKRGGRVYKTTVINVKYNFLQESKKKFDSAIIVSLIELIFKPTQELTTELAVYNPTQQLNRLI